MEILMEPLLNLKRVIESEGFKTTWRSPFFAWIHNYPDSYDSPGNDRSFFVDKLPLSSLSIPVDVAEIEITRNDDGFYFVLTFYISSILDNIDEADDFIRVIAQHDSEWLPAIKDCLKDIESKFNIEWDTRYDITIEDYLRSRFELTEQETIVNLVMAIFSALNKQKLQLKPEER